VHPDRPVRACYLAIVGGGGPVNLVLLAVTRLSVAMATLPFSTRARWVALFVVVLAAHAAATYFTLMHTFGVVVRLLNSGGVASIADKLLHLIYSVLSFSIFPLLD